MPSKRDANELDLLLRNAQRRKAVIQAANEAIDRPDQKLEIADNPNPAPASDPAPDWLLQVKDAEPATIPAIFTRPVLYSGVIEPLSVSNDEE